MRCDPHIKTNTTAERISKQEHVVNLSGFGRTKHPLTTSTSATPKGMMQVQPSMWHTCSMDRSNKNIGKFEFDGSPSIIFAHPYASSPPFLVSVSTVPLSTSHCTNAHVLVQMYVPHVKVTSKKQLNMYLCIVLVMIVCVLICFLICLSY